MILIESRPHSCLLQPGLSEPPSIPSVGLLDLVVDGVYVQFDTCACKQLQAMVMLLDLGFNILLHSVVCRG